ncbi:MAG: hypothetical protein K9M96_17755 [Deltaproteobacteria bacterium]|nr:hypothetical protein [Deltaproteobacteria bacterium]
MQIDRHPDYVTFSLEDEAGEYYWGNVIRDNWDSISIVATVTINTVSGAYASAGVIYYEIGRHHGNKISARIAIVAASRNYKGRVEGQINERQSDGNNKRLATLRFPDFDTSAVGRAVTIGLGRLGNAVYFYQAGVDAYLTYQPHYDLGDVGNSSGSSIYTNVSAKAVVQSIISNVWILNG